MCPSMLLSRGAVALVTIASRCIANAFTFIIPSSPNTVGRRRYGTNLLVMTIVSSGVVVVLAAGCPRRCLPSVHARSRLAGRADVRAGASVVPTGAEVADRLTPTPRGWLPLCAAALHPRPFVLRSARAESGVLKERGNGRTTRSVFRIPGIVLFAGSFISDNLATGVRLDTASAWGIFVSALCHRRSGVKTIRTPSGCEQYAIVLRLMTYKFLSVERHIELSIFAIASSTPSDTLISSSTEGGFVPTGAIAIGASAHRDMGATRRCQVFHTFLKTHSVSSMCL